MKCKNKEEGELKDRLYELQGQRRKGYEGEARK